MDKKIKARWVKALRSGKYKQARGTLRNPMRNSFCCLGVLCDIYRKDNGGQWDRCAFGGSSGTLPKAVSVWAGFGVLEDNPKVIIGGRHRELAAHNDSGRRFSTIAKAIEEQL